MTAAWTPRRPLAPQALNARRQRLLTSLRTLAENGVFQAVRVLDSTIDDSGRAALEALGVPGLVVHAGQRYPEGSYQGPSYLEGLLYADMPAQLLPERATTVVKVSGGYGVRNIDRLVSGFESRGLRALGFLMQHPLRFRAHFAMTSCMLMQREAFVAWTRVAADRLDELRTVPLEHVYCRHLLSLGARRGVPMPYPQLDAWFSTAGISSRNWSYRAKTLCWNALSSTGAFTLSI